jgi:hypothetical protein
VRLIDLHQLQSTTSLARPMTGARRRLPRRFSGDLRMSQDVRRNACLIARLARWFLVIHCGPAPRQPGRLTVDYQGSGARA